MAENAFKIILNQLEEIKSDFGEVSAIKKADLLKRINAIPLTGKQNLLRYHEVLLFIKAYPDNKFILNFIRKEIIRLTSALAEMAEIDPEAFHKFFVETGVVFSKSALSPSLDACNWLQKYYPTSIKLQIDDEFKKNIGTVIPFLCLDAEQDGLTDDRYDALDWIDIASHDLSGNHSMSFKWLLEKLNRMKLNIKMRDFIVEGLNMTIHFELNDPFTARTSHALNVKNCFWQKDSLIRKVDVLYKINEQGCNIKELSGKDAGKIINSAKIVLASRGRETDPITYANKVYAVSIERGLVVYLFSMMYNRKLPIENYTGFVAYRNGVPIGYGGGWLFLERCEIGVNIFDTFRGGENSLIFTNILRAYNQVFGIKKYAVPAYQFGEDNEEGLKSGAFWFYYKLGFRPEDDETSDLAKSEFSKILSGKKYRTPIRILKQLTNCPLVLENGKVKKYPEPKHLATAITKWISKEFGGDEIIASKYCNKVLIKHFGEKYRSNMTKEELFSVNSWSPLVAMSLLSENYNEDEKKSLIAIIKSKASDEIRFSTLLKGNKKLVASLKKIAKKEMPE